MENQSTVNEFILLAFSDTRELQILHFLLFLSIYLVAFMGNILIILTIAHDHNLHSPMYFFLVNLSLVDACYVSVTVPKSMAISLTNDRRISFSGCVSQVLLVFTFASAEVFFLTVMAYDRYVAICLPLHYMRIMNWNACLQFAAASWISAIVYAIVETMSTFRLNFCSSHVQQFFCDVPQLWRISCTDTMLNECLVLAVVITAGICCLSLILISYGYIFSTVFKINSSQGRRKVFSTCTPHLTVVSLFLSTAVFSYFRPQALSSTSVDLLSTVLYTVLPPVTNPIIYSLRNKDIHQAAWKMSSKLFRFHRVVSYTFVKNCKGFQ
ncbi:olfactory receptor 14A16-like [Anolis carolinensis]|uniref:olfactory receptor 14A16-like n=1 Tax=Anolis carolinensis TaxID=28377 RepID=UPI002F2B2527